MRILVADDEAPARSRLRRLVAEIGAGEVIGEAASGRAALAAVAAERPDLVLLDIRMPDGDGLAVARALAELDPPPAVIFVTALADRALAALDAGAAAYLVKPVERERLAAALHRAGRPSRAQLSALAADEEPRSHLTARVGREVRLVPLADVRYFRAADKATVAHYAGGEVVVGETLAALEAEFAEAFVRIRRNLLVAHAGIGKLVHERGAHWVELVSGERLPVARRHVRTIHRALKVRH